jgi:hypothetical protein
MKQATPTIKQTIERYARLKRVEKRLNDKLEAEKTKILAYVDNKAEVIAFNDEKLATVYPGQRTTIDGKRLEQENPSVYNQYAKLSTFLGVRIH